MPGRRSVSVEPEDLVVASPRRRSARIAVRTDSPAPGLKKELAPEKSSTPARRTRRSASIQEKSLNDIEKDVNAVSHHLKSHTASSSQESEQSKSTARRTRRSASTQETQVLPDDLKKDDTPMPLKRSKRLQSKENSIDLIEEEDKPKPTDDASPELVTTSARKRLTRSMSRSPTNTQKSKTSAPPVVKTFRNRLSVTDKNSEETKPAVLDIITENEDEIDKNENNTTKPTLETDLLNNNAKKLSEDINMETDQITSITDKETTEDSAGKSDLSAISAGDEIIKTTDTEVQSSELTLKDEIVLNTSVKSTTSEETNITVNCTNKFDIADKSVTEDLLPNNDKNVLNESKTESIIMETISVENTKVPESSDKLDGYIKETLSTEETINVSNRELNDANNYDFPINESESEKNSENSTINKPNSILEKEADMEIIDDSDSKKEIKNYETDESDNKIDCSEEIIENLEITQEEEIMDKLEINEESGECKDDTSISEESVNETLPVNTNENKDKSKMMECTDSVKKKIGEENYELSKEVVAKPTEISDATADIKKGERETEKVIITENKVKENMDPENKNSKQIDISDVIIPELNTSSNTIQELDIVKVHSDAEQTNVEIMKQNGTLDNSVAEQNIDTEVSPNKMKETRETTNKSDLEVNNETDKKEDEIHDSENVKSNNEDDVTNISIVSADKTHTSVDKCDNEEHCESNISIVDSPDSNVSSTPIKNTRIEQSDSAKKEQERNLNLSLVNDDGKSYSPIINRIETISVDFEYSTSSIVDSSSTALQENEVLNKNERNATVDNVELAAEDSYNEQSETRLETKSKSNKSNNKIPKEAKISSENLQSEEEELSNSINEVSRMDNSSSENIKKDEILNKSNTKNKTKILDSSCDENVDSCEIIEKTDVTKSKSPKKENNESCVTKAKLSDSESTEKSRDKMLDDFIECFKADKKRKRQSFDDSIAVNTQKQKRRRKHRNEVNFSSESDENSDIEESRSRNKKRNKHTIDRSEDEESEEYEGNEFIDDMASEGSEDTPSIDSNEIIDEGESVGSTDSQIDSDDDYEHGSFVVDDDVGNEELLSGSEEVECWTPKRKRIITIASDSDDELEKMSMEPFGGSSPSLMSVNQVSSVDSDLAVVKLKNEELSKLIEDKAKSDTEDVDNEDLIIVNESMNKSEELESHIEDVSESLSKHQEENIKIDNNIQQAVEEDNISNTGETVNELNETKSSEIEQMNELNRVDEDNKSLRRTSVNEKVNMEEIPGEKEKLVETIENPDISQEIIGEEKSVDKSPNKKEIIVEKITPEKKVCNEIESNVEKEIDNISSGNAQEVTEKDARYKAILDKYFKHVDDKISKSTRRRTMGMFSNETNDSADIDVTTKRKRRHSLDVEGKKSQNDIGTDMFETLYNERKKAKIPINADNDDDNMIDMKKGETEPKKTNSKAKKRTTDENTDGKIDDDVEQKYKKTSKSVKRHSLTNIENIPGKYVQSLGQLSKSFSDYSSSRETEIIQKYIKFDNNESATCMLKDFSDTVKDDIEVAKACVVSPKKKKSRKSSDESGILVPSLLELNNTTELEKSKPSPKKSLIEVSPIEKDCETLKRKKKHSKSVETLVQEELPTCEIIDTKEIEKVHTKTKKKKQIKLETHDTGHCNDQVDKDNLEINITIKKQPKNTGNIKKNKQGMKLQSVVSDVKEHSHFSKNDVRASVDVTNESAADYVNDTGVKSIVQKNINNTKPKQMSTSKSFQKNKPDDRFIVKKEHAIASKSEYDVVNELVSRNINIYKNLIRPSGRGTTGGNIKVENLHAASIKIKKEKKKQKYNRSRAEIPVPKASVTGQTTCCNFKEEFLFGSNVKRVAVTDILQKRRGVK